MNAETIRNYALGYKEVEECLPFGPDALVFKTGGKIFLIMALDESPLQINVKCVPDLAEELRAKYTAVRPGYHMNKRHWNTVVCDGSLPWESVKAFISHSYDLVKYRKPK